MGEKGALGEVEARGVAFPSFADELTREKRRKCLLDNSGKDIFAALPDEPQQAASEECLSFTKRKTGKEDPVPRGPLCGSSLGCTYSGREPSSSGRCHLSPQESSQDGEKLKEAANIPWRRLSGFKLGDGGGARFSPSVCPSAACSSSASLLSRSTVLRGSSLSPHSLPSSFLAVSLSPFFPPKRSSSPLTPSSSSDSSLSSTSLILSGPSSLPLCFPSSSRLPSCFSVSPFSVSVALLASVSPAPHAPAVSHCRYTKRQTGGKAAGEEHGARLTRVSFLRYFRFPWRFLSWVRKAAERKGRVEGRATAVSKTRQIKRGFCRSLCVSGTLWLFVLFHLLSVVCEGVSRSETDHRGLPLETKKLAADSAPSLPRVHLPLPSPLAESSRHRRLASESSSSSSPSPSSPSSSSSPSPSSPSSSRSSSPSLGSRAMSFLLGRGSENAQKTEDQKGDSVSPSSPSPSPTAAALDAPLLAGVSSGASETVSSSGAKGEASGAQNDPAKTETAATRPEPESASTSASPPTRSPATSTEGTPSSALDHPDGEKDEAGGAEREEGEKGSKSREEPPPPVFRVSSTSPSNAAVFVPAVFQQNSGEGNHVTLTIPLEVLPSLAAAGETAAPHPEEKLASQGSDKERLALSSLQWLPARESGAREREGEASLHHMGEKRRRGALAQMGASGEEVPETSPASLEELSSNEREMVLSAGLLTLLLVLSVSLVLSHVSRKCHLRWLQMPVAATLLGLLVGAVLKFGLKVQGPILGSVLAMNEDVFFVMLLPPIIFEGGLSLSEGSLSGPFMRNFGAIMWLACFCTILSFCWVGTLMFFGGVLGLSMFLTVRQAFAFGALISSTDPVSVLALFKELHAKKLIHVLVFGESLLNDAISIVLYRTIASEDTASVGSAILAFFLTFFVSLVIGLAVGLFCALTYKYMDLHKEENQTLESALLLLFPWMAYLVADGLGYSGIVAICFCGVTIGKYAVPNLSTSARTASRSVFNSFSLLAETVVFAFLGLAVFSFDQPLHDELAVGLYVLGFVATFSARAVSVFVTCTLINLFRTNAKITPQQQLALVLCGLRGAIAFALSERARRDFGGKEGAALLSLTLFLALFTILVLGKNSSLQFRFLFSWIFSSLLSGGFYCSAPRSLPPLFSPEERETFASVPVQDACIHCHECVEKVFPFTFRKTHLHILDFES
uniref:Na+/H+ exchanger NHE3 n=1 Tax=Toxoplasma gondii TgCATBr9 TaxID=943120 RepID=A0A2T6IKW6_TOXGO|nr:Na+/H+ exchanger NHE3 [Toxoplasma gondii TgCATBr9]